MLKDSSIVSGINQRPLRSVLFPSGVYNRVIDLCLPGQEIYLKADNSQILLLLLTVMLTFNFTLNIQSDRQDSSQDLFAIGYHNSCQNTHSTILDTYHEFQALSNENNFEMIETRVD